MRCLFAALFDISFVGLPECWITCGIPAGSKERFNCFRAVFGCASKLFDRMDLASL